MCYVTQWFSWYLCDKKITDTCIDTRLNKIFTFSEENMSGVCTCKNHDAKHDAKLFFWGFFGAFLCEVFSANIQQFLMYALFSIHPSIRLCLSMYYSVWLTVFDSNLSESRWTPAGGGRPALGRILMCSSQSAHHIHHLKFWTLVMPIGKYITE